MQKDKKTLFGETGEKSGQTRSQKYGKEEELKKGTQKGAEGIEKKRPGFQSETTIGQKEGDTRGKKR